MRDFISTLLILDDHNSNLLICALIGFMILEILNSLYNLTNAEFLIFGAVIAIIIPFFVRIIEEWW